MKCILLDAHISPSLAVWITDNFAIPCYSMSYLGLSSASDEEIFEEATKREALIISKDVDFLNLQNRLGAPPKILWLTCGNTSKQRLKEIFTNHLQEALDALQDNDLVEISGK